MSSSSLIRIRTANDLEQSERNQYGQYLLQGADLQGAQLEGRHLEGAHLEGADLQRVRLEGAHLEGAQLQRAHLRRAQLQRAHLEGAHLENARLDWAQLHGTHLEGAHLEDAYLLWADLPGAHLEGAHLQRANLAGADLRNAHLEGADLTRANLSGTKISPSNFGLLSDFQRTQIYTEPQRRLHPPRQVSPPSDPWIPDTGCEGKLDIISQEPIMPGYGFALQEDVDLPKYDGSEELPEGIINLGVDADGKYMLGKCYDVHNLMHMPGVRAIAPNTRKRFEQTTLDRIHTYRNSTAYRNRINSGGRKMRKSRKSRKSRK